MALYELAPAAHRIAANPPYDPYELRLWAVRRIRPDQAGVRYQFQTGDMEMADFIQVLSRSLPSLTFTLATLCLDSSTIEAYQFQSGKKRKWELLERRREFHWGRAQLKFGLAADDYSDPEAESWAEDEMLHEALTHWDKADATTHPESAWPL